MRTRYSAGFHYQEVIDVHSVAIEDISGFYGPGAYWAWVITTISAMASTLSAGRAETVSFDFIGSSLYTLASLGDLQLRACQNCDQKIEFQLKASLQVISASSILSFVTLITGELWHKDNNTVFSSGQWQLWKALILVPLMQGSLWAFWWINHTDYPLSLQPVLFIVSCSIVWGLWHMFRGNAFQRTIRYSYALMVAHGLGLFDYSKGSSFTRPTFSPLSGAKLSDMDQALTLATTTLVMMIQWKPWRRISSWVDRFRNRYKRKDGLGRYNRNIPLMIVVEETIL
jgi:hypothetical protein